MSNPTTHISTFDGSASGWTVVDPERYDGGLWLEQAGANYMTRPLAVLGITSPAGTVLERWQRLGTGASITRVTGQSPPYGTYAVEVVTTGAGANEGIRTYHYGLGALTGSTDPTVGSIYVKGTGNVNVQSQIVYTDASGSAIRTQAVTLTSGWTRIILPLIALNDAKTVSYLCGCPAAKHGG